MAMEFGPATVEDGGRYGLGVYSGFPVTGTITGVVRTVDALHAAGHSGTDIAAPSGTPIRSPAPGVVLHVSHDDRIKGDDEVGSGPGNSVVVEWEDGSVSNFLHMRDHPSVAVGEQVPRGGLLGLVGSTGRSTGPHLHWGWAPMQSQLYDRTAIMDALTAIVAVPSVDLGDAAEGLVREVRVLLQLVPVLRGDGFLKSVALDVVENELKDALLAAGEGTD